MPDNVNTHSAAIDHQTSSCLSGLKLVQTRALLAATVMWTTHLHDPINRQHNMCLVQMRTEVLTESMQSRPDSVQVTMWSESAVTSCNVSISPLTTSLFLAEYTQMPATSLLICDGAVTSQFFQVQSCS